MIYFAAALALALLALIWIVIESPDGYEDEQGFHEGKEHK